MLKEWIANLILAHFPESFLQKLQMKYIQRTYKMKYISIIVIEVRNNMIETRFHFQTYIPSIKSLNARYIFIHRIFTERFRVFNLKISGLDSKYSKNSKHKHTLCAFCTYIVPCILSSLEFEKKSIYSIKQF